MSQKNKLKEVQEIIQKLRKDYPDLVGPFLMYIRKVEEKGALEIKTKKLIAVSLAVALKCEWCIAYHTKTALDAGASVDELVEACAVAILMAGAPAMMATKLVLDAIQDFAQ